jgi:type I restriction enzyme S subunit
MNLKYKKYDNYKPSGVEWLGDVPQHWEVKPLFSMSKLKSETNFTDLELLSVYLNKGVIRFKDVEQKRTNVTSKDLSKYQLVEKGDFVLNNQQAWRGSVGVSNYKGIISPAYLILSLSDIINPNFANYSFRNGGIIKQFLIGSRGVGTIQRNLYWSELKRVMVNVPPKPEQNAIANFLDRKTAQIDKSIAQKEQLIELLKERRQILIHEAVTQGLDKSVKVKDSGVEWIGEVPKHWEVKKLRYIAKILRGASPRPSGDPKYFGSNDVNWITVGDITKDNDVYLKSSKEFLTKRGKELSRFLKKGTFVLTNSGATLGVPKILDIDGCINDGVVAFINFDEDNFSKLFIYYYLQSLTNTLRDKMNQGATQPNLNTDIVRNMFVPFTTLENQIEIVNYIETQSQKIKTAILLKQQEIAALKEYKTVLIDAAVTGKIVVD